MRWENITVTIYGKSARVSVHCSDWLSHMLPNLTCFPSSFCLLWKVNQQNDVTDTEDENRAAGFRLREETERVAYKPWWLLPEFQRHHLCPWPLALNCEEYPEKSLWNWKRQTTKNKNFLKRKRKRKKGGAFWLLSDFRQVTEFSVPEFPYL